MRDEDVSATRSHHIRTAVGHEAWLVTDYAHVRELLADNRLRRSRPGPQNAARIGESALFGGPLGDFATEHTDHARMPALLQPHFSPEHMRALRTRIDAMTTQLLDDLADSEAPADLHATVALPLPILVICELLGVAYYDRDQFRAWTEPAADITDRAVSEQGLGNLFGYGMRLVETNDEHSATT